MSDENFCWLLVVSIIAREAVLWHAARKRRAWRYELDLAIAAERNAADKIGPPPNPADFLARRADWLNACDRTNTVLAKKSL